MLLLLACALESVQSVPVEPPCPHGEQLEGSRCLPVECGIGVWGDLPDEGIHVDPLAPPEGDGSRDRPFNDLRPALALGGTVLLAEGTYMGPFRDGGLDVEVIGRCRALVNLTATTEESQPVLTVRTQPVWVGLKDLTVSGGVIGIEALDHSEVSLTRVHIDQPGDIGIYVLGGHVTVQDVLITDPVPVETEDAVGVSISIGWMAGSDVTVDGGSLGIENAGSVDMERLVVRNQRSVGVYAPAGLLLDYAGSVSCRDCLFENIENVGVMTTNGGYLVLADTVVREIHNLPGIPGVGIMIHHWGEAYLDGVVVEDVQGDGMRVTGEYSGIISDDTLVRRVVGIEGNPGVGVRAMDLGVIRGVSLQVEQIEGAGVACTGGLMRLPYLQVRDISPSVPFADGRIAGPGLFVDEGCVARVDRAAIYRADTFGVVVQGEGSTLQSSLLVDSTTGATRPVDVVVQLGGSASLTDSVLTGPDHGLIAWGGSVEVEGLELPPSKGVGVVAQEGGAFVGTDVHITGRTGWGVGAALDSTLALTDSSVSYTVRDADRSIATAVASDSSEVHLTRVEVGPTRGIGVATESGGVLTLTDSRVEDSVLAGVFVGPEGSLVCTGSVVEGALTEQTVGMGVGLGVVQGSAELNRCEVSGGAHSAVWASDSELLIADSVLTGGPRQWVLETLTHGDALVSDHSLTRVQNSALVDAEGWGLLALGGSVELDEVAFEGNTGDILVQECEGDVVTGLPGEGDMDICPQVEEITLSLDFYNAVRLDDIQ
jgi:hypothetical protein